jgi:parallel beta-helix repeat protein
MKQFYYSILFALCLASMCTAWSADIYVNGATGNDADSGSGWATAKRTISQALVVAASGTDIRVAEGTYLESITMKSGVALYGGYAGISNTSRDIAVYATTIDGSTANGGNPSTCVVGFSEINSAGIDGFTITGGSVTQDRDDAALCFDEIGNGIYIVDCTISGNLGNGAYFYESSPAFTDCTLSDNAYLFAFFGPSYPSFTNCNVDSLEIMYGGSATFTNCNVVNCYCYHGGKAYFTNCNITGSMGFHVGGAEITDSTLEGSYLNGANSSGLKLTNCLFDGGGISYDSGVTINDCTIRNCPGTAIQNDSGIILRNSSITNCSGGGIRCYRGSLTVTNSIISGNKGRGIYTDYAQGAITNSIISNNVGGGLYIDSSPLRITNCVISDSTGGNAVSFGSFSSGSTFTNCTISNNQRGVYFAHESEATFINTIFSNNAGYAIYDDNYADPRVSHCLFYNNPDGDYIADGSTVYTGAAQINSVRGASDNVDGDPRFVMSEMGSWSTFPIYDATGNVTIITNYSALYTPGALVSRLINTNVNQRRQSLIVGNTTTEIAIAGDVTDWTDRSDVYQLIDYHLGYGSAAIDAGTSTNAPATDIEGVPRPIDIPGHGSGLVYDIGAYEARALPDVTLIVSGEELAFGSQGGGCGPTAAKQVIIANVGLGDLTFTGNGIEITGEHASEFLFTTPIDTSPLTPGANRIVGVAFDPNTGVLHRRAYLTITTNDVEEPSLNLPMWGMATLLSHTPTPTPVVRGDIFPDGVLSGFDLLAFSLDWNRNETEFSLISDLIDDGTINADDLLELIDLIRKR